MWYCIHSAKNVQTISLLGGVATVRSVFGQSVGANYVLEKINCTGNESNIFDCPHPLGTRCGGVSEEAGVICGVTPGEYIVTLT